MATLVEHHPDRIIGTFWLASTPKDYNELTCKWVDYVLEENQAQALRTSSWFSRKTLLSSQIILRLY